MNWPLRWEDVQFHAANTPFRHLQFFPDMAPQWAWMRARLGDPSTRSGQAEALNLFGYTGVGALALSACGARLTHVDASKKSVEAGKANVTSADKRTSAPGSTAPRKRETVDTVADALRVMAQYLVDETR